MRIAIGMERNTDNSMKEEIHWIVLVFRNNNLPSYCEQPSQESANALATAAANSNRFVELELAQDYWRQQQALSARMTNCTNRNNNAIPRNKQYKMPSC